jgi:hypothetical protein
MNSQGFLFDDKDIIFKYTRADAIKDGILIGVTNSASQQDIKCPVAITKALWDQYIVTPEISYLHCKSTEGRLSDTLMFYKHAAKNFKGSVLFFEASYVFKGNMIKRVKLKAICGPGDAGEMVVTIMLPNED